MKKDNRNITIVIPTHGTRNVNEILKDIDKKKNKIIIIEDKDFKGPSWGRNEGFKKADTEYVIFLDSDVYITQAMIDKMLKEIKDVDIVFPYVEFEDGLPYFPAERYSKPKFPGLGACFMCKKESLIKNNIFFDEKYILNFEETDFFILCDQKGLTAKYLPELKAIHQLKNNKYHFVLDKTRYYLEWRNYLYARWKLKKYLHKTKVQHALSLKYILLFIYRVIFKSTKIKKLHVLSLIKKYSRFYLFYLYIKGYFEYLKLKKREKLCYRDSYLSNKSFILKVIHYIIMQLKIRVFHIPTRMIIYITDRCNARCEHCFFWRELNKNNDPTLEEFEALIDTMPKMDTISITGGEPFLRKDIYDIIKIFSKKAKKIAISTNGTFSEHIFNTVQKVLSNLDVYLSIQVSIDGMRETHNKIRGVNIFDNVVETLKKLKTIDNDRFTFNILTVITNHNYKEIDKIVDYFYKKLKINVFFEFVRGAPKEKDVNLPPYKEIEKVVKKIQEVYKTYKKDKMLLYIDLKMLEAELFVHKNNKKIYNCFAGKGTGVIYSNGNLSVCELFPPFSNLKKYKWNFKKCWNSKEARKARKKVKGCFCIHGCWLFQNILLSPKAMFNYYVTDKKFIERI